MVLALKKGLCRDDYVSEAVFAKERACLRRDGFAFVGRASELRAPGSFIAIEPWGERIVIYRARDLSLRAFVDLCVHRALPLTLGSEGTLGPQGLTCPYHGLTYSDAGEVRAPKGSLSALLYRGRTLEARTVVEHWGNVFVALGPSSRTFKAYLDGAPPWLDASFHASLANVHRARFRTQANWKLIVENFQESWHFPHVHPGLHARTPHGATTSVSLGKNWFGGTMKFDRDTRTVAPSRTLGARKWVAGPGWRKHVYDAYMFPLWLTSLQPDYFLTYRVTPRSPAETEVQADIWGHVASVNAKTEMEWAELAAFWQRTNQEDRDIVERQMLGVESPSFEHMNLSPTEEQGLLAFQRRYQRALRKKEARD